MKTMTSIVASLFIMCNLAAQIVPPVVHDPVTHAHLVTSIETANETVSNVKKQVDLLEQAKEGLSKVNNVIRQVQLIDKIIEDQKKAVKTFNESYDYIRKSNMFDPGEVNVILKNFTRAIRKSEKMVSLATSAGKDGIMKMNDKERIDLLMTTSDEISEINAEISELDFRYRRIADKRAVRTFFNSEDTK